MVFGRLASSPPAKYNLALPFPLGCPTFPSPILPAEYKSALHLGGGPCPFFPLPALPHPARRVEVGGQSKAMLRLRWCFLGGSQARLLPSTTWRSTWAALRAIHFQFSIINSPLSPLPLSCPPSTTRRSQPRRSQAVLLGRRPCGRLLPTTSRRSTWAAVRAPFSPYLPFPIPARRGEVGG